MSKKFVQRQSRFMSITLMAGLMALLSLSACGDSTATTNPPTAAATVAAATAAQMTAATVAGTTTATTTTGAASTAATTTSAATTSAATTSAATTAAQTTAVTGTTAATTTTAAGTATTTSASGTTAASTGSDTTPKVVDATNAFLATLDSNQKAAVLFDWSNTTQKQKWSNFPEGLFSRSGIMWGNMTDAQKTAWLAVMSTTLSKEGYTRVINEWNADDALAASSSGGGGPGGNLQYGKQYYWIAIIGTPSTTSAWQWQWGGHHVTVNATVYGTSISLNPSFIGDQPATYKDASGNTVRPLGDIDDTAIALLNSLDATEKTKAVLGTTSIDLVLGPGEDGKKIASEGLKASDMTTAQQATLMTLLGFYGNLVNEEDAVARLADLKSHLADTYFVWYGSTTTPNMGYWRVTGPTVVIEYSPQSMGGNSSEHIHGIYRDPTNDYGAAIVNQ